MSLREPQSELDWQALQYIAGDLDAAASAEFESRLADEQAAREAVARAVELTQVIVAAESQSPPPKDLPLEYVSPAGIARSGDWGVRLSWMAIGGLLSLLIAVLATSGVLRQQPVGPNVNGELAAAWSETRQELTAAEAESIGPLHPLSAALWENGDEMNDALDETPLLVDTPSWMTAAVVGVAGQGADNAPEDEESSVN